MAVKRKTGPKRAKRVGKAKTRKTAAVKKTRPSAAKKAPAKTAKKAVPRAKAKTKPAAEATTATFDLKSLIRQAVAQRQSRRELLDKLGGKPRAGSTADTDPVTNMRRRILRNRLTVGPHTPGEGEDDSALPTLPLMGGPRGVGDPEDA